METEVKVCDTDLEKQTITKSCVQRQKEHRKRKTIEKRPSKIPKTNAQRQQQFRLNRKIIQQSETLNSKHARKKNDAERSKRYRDRLKSKKRRAELDSLSSKDHSFQPSMNNEAQRVISHSFQSFQAPYEEHDEYSMPNALLRHEPNIAGDAVLMATIKVETPDDYQIAVKADDRHFVPVKQEYPLNLDDKLIKIEETTVQFSDENNVKQDINFRHGCHRDLEDRKSFFKHNFSAEMDPLKITQSDDLSTQIHHCVSCEKILDAEQNLQDHLKIHFEQNNFMCKQYQKDLPDSCQVEIHKLVHRTAPQLKCEFREDIFPEKSIATVHKQQSARDKPYGCDFCEKKFSQKIHLTKHKRTHTGDRPYKCDLCEKTFVRGNSLNQHKRTHTSDWP